MPEQQTKSVMESFGDMEAQRIARDRAFRERWVKIMEFRIVQEGLHHCFHSEGVNHYENCKEWSERYLKLLKEVDPLNNGQGPQSHPGSKY